MTRLARSPLADELALAALLLAAVAAAGGLLIPGLYRDADAWVRQAQASDLTTLLMALPLLALGLWRAHSGSTAGRLLTWGALGYLAYGYAIFAFAVATNPMTPLHYAVLGLSSWSLILSLVAVAHGGEIRVAGRLPRRITGWFLVAGAALFAVLWLGEIAGSISSGETAPAVAALGLPTNPVWALDLAFALPVFAVGGVMLLRWHPLASAVATPALVFVAVMGASILVIFAFDALAGAAVDPVPVALIGTLVAIASALLVVGIAPRPRDRRRTLAVTAAVLEVGLALGAIGGGAALMLGPRGEIVPLPVSALAGSPFDSYFLPGLVLFTVLGLGPLAVAGLAIRRQRIAPLLTVMVGVALLLWLAVQIAIIGFALNPPLQPMYVVLGVVIVAVGLAWWRSPAARSPLGTA